jgi:hypothetical protein
MKSNLKAEQPSIVTFLALRFGHLRMPPVCLISYGQ